MNVKGIVKGHVNELLGRKQELSEARMEICNACPLKVQKTYGAVCDPQRFVNPDTNEISFFPKEGFYKGCGCRLNAKTRDAEEICPAQKW